MTKLIDEVITKVVKNAPPQTGFNVSNAEKEEEETVLEVVALAQCRADVPSQECTACLQKAAKEIKKICPNRVDDRIWYEYCHLRYDNSGDFLSFQDTDFRVVHYNVEYVSDPITFNKALNELTDQMKVALKLDSKEFGK
ncbi:cysteine-rich repeat secretory protein 55-like [Bidens hawaiensis]|uniref:cysteine-rich repeat secretory protein 55-like n=1 Tax=Bidens hawaiensis TaxID=980011 RepID=UPI00404A92A9